MLLCRCSIKNLQDFRLTYTITLSGNTLKTVLGVKNTGVEQFTFQSLLHTYFRVKNIANVGVIGLTGYPFVDKVSNEIKIDQEMRPIVTIDSEVDRIYERVKHDTLTLTNTGIGGGIALKKMNYDQVGNDDFCNILYRISGLESMD